MATHRESHLLRRCDLCSCSILSYWLAACLQWLPRSHQFVHVSNWFPRCFTCGTCWCDLRRLVSCTLCAHRWWRVQRIARYCWLPNGLDWIHFQYFSAGHLQSYCYSELPGWLEPSRVGGLPCTDRSECLCQRISQPRTIRLFCCGLGVHARLLPRRLPHRLEVRHWWVPRPQWSQYLPCHLPARDPGSQTSRGHLRLTQSDCKPNWLRHSCSHGVSDYRRSRMPLWGDSRLQRLSRTSGYQLLPKHWSVHCHRSRPQRFWSYLLTHALPLWIFED